MVLLALDMAMCVTMTIALMAAVGIGVIFGRAIEHTNPTRKRGEQ